MEHILDLGQDAFFFCFSLTRTDLRDSVAFILADIASCDGRDSRMTG
jgi:hypothetical protein